MQNHIATPGCECLHHLPYSPDLTLSDFHYPSLKKNLAGRRYGSNEEVKQAVKRFFQGHNPEFFLEDFLMLIKRIGSTPAIGNCLGNLILSQMICVIAENIRLPTTKTVPADSRFYNGQSDWTKKGKLVHT
ncbi:histone-lysine N-methyltransferase SETMAR [Trichonephila clavipes]|uniref:Histone-lysine N-methyltransferase SETMAR n=1 Tax=Trichonephila clavipes TaxID=2585209 RepID=A0A8X6VXL8_TRICX|nr:histone-lysine N-methyltransferase SETMAR [Trichonephila clavipes]